MARKCKCTHCKKELTTDIAYKVTVNGKNKYYCTKEEYETIQNEINDKNKCLETISTILNIPFVPPMMVREINDLTKFYSYIVIDRAFKDNEKNIRWFIENRDSSSEYGKIKYIMTIIKNNINSTYKKYIKEQEQLTEMFKTNDKEIDMDIMNITNDGKSNDISDISEFL